MNKRKNISLILLSILLLPIVLHIGLCFLLYFFEPVSYNAPDLSQADFSFEMYNKFSKELNDKFYIKQISHNDIVSAPDDIRLKYVDDTILVISDTDADYNSMSSLFNSVGGKICGFIDIIDFYQVSIENSTYEELTNICSVLSKNDSVKRVIIDYFEETPVSEISTDDYAEDLFEYDDYYLSMIDAYKAWDLSENITNTVTVGVFDIPIYSEHQDLTIINKNEYSVNLLNNELISSMSSHGTHVAGIISASDNGNTPGICSNAKIYSENGINNSISYWIASVTNMIVNYNIKALNFSMGYNSFVSVSASLGCENAINYIINENEFFEACLDNLLNNGYEFLLCIAAGNEHGTELYKTKSPYFTYGDKNILSYLDILQLFSEKAQQPDALYSLCFTAIDDIDVRDRIMIVASCDTNKNISNFSTLGDAVDIAAPGEKIYSTGYLFTYEFMSGTSMATPFVSGAAALLFSIDESLSGAQVKDILLETSSDRAVSYGFDYPILNIGNAVEYVINN
ncbi:MAG: S8 family serine peptidase [Clostridia bacterium]|nr:S8 family serine peptidase [Clostridia bacterium]